MRLFNWKAARPTARPALTRGFGSSVSFGGDWPSGYEAQVRAAYLGNAVAQRAVRIVAEGAGSVTVDATPDGHPASALIAGSLIETIATQLLLHGNAFVQIMGDADGVPAMLYPLRPERVTVEPDASGWPIACLYRAAGQTMRLPMIGADAGTRSVSVAGSGVFTGSAAEARLKNNVLAGTLDDYQLSFESGATMQGRFLLTKLDYSGDFNGERAYTLALESSGSVVSL